MHGCIRKCGSAVHREERVGALVWQRSCGSMGRGGVMLSPHRFVLRRVYDRVSKLKELLEEGERGESFMFELKAGVGVKKVCVI